MISAGIFPLLHNLPLPVSTRITRLNRPDCIGACSWSCILLIVCILVCRRCRIVLLVIVIESKNLACRLSVALVLLSDSFTNGRNCLGTCFVGFRWSSLILKWGSEPSKCRRRLSFGFSSEDCLIVVSFFQFPMSHVWMYLISLSSCFSISFIRILVKLNHSKFF